MDIWLDTALRQLHAERCNSASNRVDEELGTFLTFFLLPYTYGVPIEID